MPEKGQKNPFHACYRFFEPVQGTFRTLANTGGREHPSRDAGRPCMHAHWEQKGLSDQGHGPARWISHPPQKVCRFFWDLPSTCEIAFKPAKTVARIFVDPCLCSAGFISGPACLRRACKGRLRLPGGLNACTRSIKCPPSRHTTPDVHTAPEEPSIHTG